MFVLLIYAGLAGLATVLSPCILPILPVVLGAGLGGDHRRPMGVVSGLVLSFATGTLAITALVTALHLPADALRTTGIALVALMGLSLLLPGMVQRVELAVSSLGRLGTRVPGPARPGFGGGLALGVGLGLVWTPCAGPILASVVALAATQQVSPSAVAVIVAYALGAALPMFSLAYGGQLVVQRVRRLARHSGTIQRAFGVIMLVTALALASGLDRRFQVWATSALPGGWTTPFSSVEASAPVRQALARVLHPAVAPPPTATRHPMALSAQEAALGLQDLGPAPEFVGITRWFNTPQPLTLAHLRGRVVLVDFWTYSCINCLRTLPHLKDWYARYHTDGLEIVGVHSPEFAFEGIAANVAAAIRQWAIPYPVALDAHYGTWTAYHNQYWPAEYVLDTQGHVVYTSFGEGDYTQTEHVIRHLLVAAGQRVAVRPGTVPDLTPTYQTTAETYVGSARSSGFASLQPVVPGTAQDFTMPATLSAGQFALAGHWRVAPQYATALRAGDRLDFTLMADKVFVILAPGRGTTRVRVLLDGRPVASGRNAGADVQQGVVRVDRDNLYNVVDLHGRVETHRLRLVFETAGSAVYSFTFG